MNKNDHEKYIALSDGSVVRLDNFQKTLQNAEIESSFESTIIRENQLKRAIWDAVMELDRTKHSFRSKQIEKIKKDLMKVLLDESVQ